MKKQFLTCSLIWTGTATVARPIILSHSGSILLCWPKKRQMPARPSSPRALRPHPGHNLGLGWQSITPRAPTWAVRSAQSFVAIRSDRRLARAFREVKTPPQLVHSQTLESFCRSLLSLLRSLFSAEHNRVSDESESASERTVE